MGSMLDGIRELPLESMEAFGSDHRNPAAAESYLRRALEGLLDIGRHILAKGFGEGVLEYKQVARCLADRGVLSREAAGLLIEMAGYRNRMVHFYDEISHHEIFDICTGRLADLERVLDEILSWLPDHPEKLDERI